MLFPMDKWTIERTSLGEPAEMISDSEPQMPEQIGRFKILGALGEGAMSNVYKAFDPEINRTIAIKLLRGECAADPEYRYRFLQEAKAAGKLTHPNIVTIYDVGEIKEGPYIAMEYLEGPTLEETMESGQPISLRDAVIYGIQIAEALDYSHANGIIHRDIKPSNIISPGGVRNLRITDFGIAHMDTLDKQRRTHMGAVLGTPQYMSPEQVEGLTVDGRSDLFSLGVILYQLITGDKPFTSETLTSLLMKIVQDEPAPIDQKVPGILPSLQKIVEKLLKKQPEQRFQSGREVADSLRWAVHEIDEREEQKNQAKIFPLRIKWTATMAFMVTLAMLLGSYLVYRKQVDAMTMLALDSGGSLAEFIAIESAEAVLIQDWIAIETFVKEVSERQQISYLRIIDHKDIVRGATSADRIGKPISPSPKVRKILESDGMVISEASHDGEGVFDFEVPINFQKKVIGRAELGLSQAPLKATADLTLYTMLGLLIAVVLTVVIVAYLLAARITTPMKMLKRALSKVRKGNLNYRINETRNDELGQLFTEYNSMADVLYSMKEDEQALDGAAGASDETVRRADYKLNDLLDAQDDEMAFSADEPTRIITTSHASDNETKRSD